MSSTESNDEARGEKFHQRKRQKRLPRACDSCRRRKSNGSGKSGEKCTSCFDFKLDCTCVSSPNFRPVVNLQNSYLDLQAELQRSQALVRQLREELAAAQLPSPPQAAFAPTAPKAAGDKLNPQEIDIPIAAMRMMQVKLRSLTSPPAPPHKDDLHDVELARKFQNMSLCPRLGSFFGRSSQAVIVNAALEFMPNEEAVLGPKSTPESAIQRDRARFERTRFNLRPQYWKWNRVLTTPSVQGLDFPHPALMSECIELYFLRLNIFLPLLHRPTFERAVADGLHLRDGGFAATLSLVCAIGSRWSTDPTLAEQGLDCGWKWFDQVQLAGKRLLGQANLYDLQTYVLATEFLKGSAPPQTWWTLVGVGLRRLMMIQDLGVHRRKAAVETPSAERELQKRALWILVYLDRMASCVLGRTSSVHLSDFDVELPLAVDDEYWEEPTHPFQQPADKPSQITFFNTLMTLNHRLGFSLGILYSLKTTRAAMAITDEWEAQIIAELDSSLNDWRDQIPEHLRWDPDHKDPVFFEQSATLYGAFAHVQIVIHRSFIPMLHTGPALLPSLEICTMAARSCANICEVQNRRGNFPRPLNVVGQNHAVFTAALMLLLNILGSKRSGKQDATMRELMNVTKCTEALRAMEERDILETLALLANLPLPVCRTTLVTRPSPPESDGPPLGPPAPNAAYDSFQFESLEGYSFGAELFDTPDVRCHAPNTHNGYGDTYVDPVQGTYAPEGIPMMSMDTLATWMDAPTGLRVEDWGSYFATIGESFGMYDPNAVPT
ncbi:Zn(2)-C6 fungal-type domain-containing protein [Favolaschia claudopus]|uniref:Zn(2)-C6 fungal-type domain-containing protein n=1 Tax=Favolaschia claudopus TaxID=2862362 RepID=A0AAW0DJJ6_9AGAR